MNKYSGQIPDHGGVFLPDVEVSGDWCPLLWFSIVQ